MAGLKQIKTKIVAMKKSQTVTKAMEAVSAAKMRKAQQTALRGRAYARAAAATLSRLSGSKQLAAHALLLPRPGAAKAMYVVITSDKGLAGALNSAVLKSAWSDIQKSGLPRENIEVVAIGKKASDFFSARGCPVVLGRSNVPIEPGAIDELIALLTQRYATGEYRFVKIVYQNFVSTFEQRPVMRSVFPLSLAELQKVVADIVPARGAYARKDAERVPNAYTLEPSEEEIVSVILPKLAGVFLYHALLESQASEHSARMVAMKSASDKAGEMQDTLTLQFNKARQSAITREVSEITGGMEAMAS